MSKKRNVDMSAEPMEVKIVAAAPEVVEVTANDEITEVNAEAGTEQASAIGRSTSGRKKSQGRSKKYQAVRSNVDKTKLYDPFAAIELVKRLSYSSFEGTISAHGVTRDEGMNVEVSFPHTTGKKRTVAILDDKVMADIEAGNVTFDVLLARPDQMKDLTRFARVLGPKGLMPNPKTGTLTTDPEKKKQELEGGKVTIKGEKKAPLFHAVIGKTGMETKELVENLTALINAYKNKLVKLTIAASMSPGVKVDFSQVE
ncbi:MAG TPA: 50S ribosomal protein L1 [Patescibacteria group bacterium]